MKQISSGFILGVLAAAYLAAGYAADAQCDAAWLAVLIASGSHARDFAFGERR